MNEEAKFHWAEGMKYAMEGIKTLLLLNGGAAVSILTFIGNTKIQSNKVIIAMICFAFGAVSAALALWSAYLAQLSYGNSQIEAKDGHHKWRLASIWHHVTYIVVLSGILLFCAGILIAAYGLWTR